MTFYTYMWLREDGTPYYIGKGCSLRAHRKGSPIAERVLIQEHASETDAFAAEVFFIAYYGRKDKGTGCLCNRTDGGDGSTGATWVMSIEGRSNISAAMLGNNNAAGGPGGAGRSKGCKAWNEGRPCSAAHRQHLKDARRNRVACSSNTRRKMSNSIAAWWSTRREQHVVSQG